MILWGLCMRFTRNWGRGSMNTAIRKDCRCNWKKAGFPTSGNWHFIPPTTAERCLLNTALISCAKEMSL